MFTLLVLVILLVAILLSVVILLQSGKGGGLAGIAAGGQATQILGARQAPDFLEKATWTLGTALIVLCFLAPFTIGNDDARSILQERLEDQPIEAPGTEAPGAVPVTPGSPGPDVPGETPSAPPAPAQEAPETSDE
ncbi:MAG: preprotein translocase subunit SecG [Rubricoccaceae bacterium]|nr:preprotein translocase subunit SecG [Rubricoccaceae bacterium]